MTTAADITVKKADGTTNILWSLVAASGGDSSPATWRSNTAPGTLGQRPTIQLKSRSNGDNTARRIDFTAVFPSTYTDAGTGLTQIRSKAVWTGSVAMPLDMADADRNEQAAQIANLLASALFVGTFNSGYAPT
jgi:hypothetical protein